MTTDTRPETPSHTPTPWRLGQYPENLDMAGDTEVCVDKATGGSYVLAACNSNFPEAARANARRIVACVNACEGLSNEELDVVEPGALSKMVTAASTSEAPATYLIIIHREKASLLSTRLKGIDRLGVPAASLEEAMGKFLMDNPKLTYSDIRCTLEADTRQG